ncbi:Tat binding protein 1(TBP-1)-interacting protein, putative [Plasmodium ovale wallikeri]|uniref:Tat binding protein 1(TBP-1)-interacting protein, putative n=2 Tax=Plasmodium ovale TaxID=36330 RepID=A0A1A8ZJR2_PLAOA|nr:Tat binding protein 1(TBP-1)-interacting protein, putative [Plasmodium ovale wallikeri]SBT44769.1 Tat binding protein 1(TBP-1)-interacting protein, putative [Plasmodium ovale wallikeri]
MFLLFCNHSMAVKKAKYSKKKAENGIRGNSEKVNMHEKDSEKNNNILGNKTYGEGEKGLDGDNIKNDGQDEEEKGRDNSIAVNNSEKEEKNRDTLSSIAKPLNTFNNRENIKSSKKRKNTKKVEKGDVLSEVKTGKTEDSNIVPNVQVPVQQSVELGEGKSDAKKKQKLGDTKKDVCVRVTPLVKKDIKNDDRNSNLEDVISISNENDKQTTGNKQGQETTIDDETQMGNDKKEDNRNDIMHKGTKKTKTNNAKKETKGKFGEKNEGCAKGGKKDKKDATKSGADKEEVITKSGADKEEVITKSGADKEEVITKSGEDKEKVITKAKGEKAKKGNNLKKEKSKTTIKAPSEKETNMFSEQITNSINSRDDNTAKTSTDEKEKMNHSSSMKNAQSYSVEGGLNRKGVDTFLDMVKRDSTKRKINNKKKKNNEEGDNSKKMNPSGNSEMATSEGEWNSVNGSFQVSPKGKKVGETKGEDRKNEIRDIKMSDTKNDQTREEKKKKKINRSDEVNKGKPVKTILSETDSKEKIFKYMKQTNRPYSAVNVYDNLHGSISKTCVQKFMDELSAEKRLQCKEYGKAKVYIINQKEFKSLNMDDINKLKKDIEIDREHIEVAKNCYTNLLKKKKIMIKDLELIKNVYEYTKGIVQIEEDIKHYEETNKNCNLTPYEIDTIKKKHGYLHSMWFQRKNLCYEIIKYIATLTEKDTQGVIYHLGIDLDEDVLPPGLYF